MASSKNRELRISQACAKVTRISAARERHEQMLAQHDQTCGHLRVGNVPVSRVDDYRKKVRGI